MVSLREEILGVSSVEPSFRLLLPEGWTAHRISESTADHFEARAGDVFRRAGRPDLDGAFASILRRSMRDLEKAGAEWVILPAASEERGSAPLSLIVSVISGQNGQPLDSWVAQRFREGARMLDDAGRIVTWRARKAGSEAGVEQVQSSYLIPVPETDRKKGLLLTGTVMIEAGAPDDSDAIVASSAAFDAISSTVSWVVPADVAQ
jgi:hypothetical protein